MHAALQHAIREIGCTIIRSEGDALRETHTRFAEALMHQVYNGKEASDRNKGEGSVVIDGDSGATPEGLCIVVGARPGIDGAYRIDTVDHELSRDSGFTTTLSLKQPQGSAGTDTR
jgi:phage protein D